MPQAELTLVLVASSLSPGLRETFFARLDAQRAPELGELLGRAPQAAPPPPRAVAVAAAHPFEAHAAVTPGERAARRAAVVVVVGTAPGTPEPSFHDGDEQTPATAAVEFQSVPVLRLARLLNFRLGCRSTSGRPPANGRPASWVTPADRGPRRHQGTCTPEGRLTASSSGDTGGAAKALGQHRQFDDAPLCKHGPASANADGLGEVLADGLKSHAIGCASTFAVVSAFTTVADPRRPNPALADSDAPQARRGIGLFRSTPPVATGSSSALLSRAALRSNETVLSPSPELPGSLRTVQFRSPLSMSGSARVSRSQTRTLFSEALTLAFLNPLSRPASRGWSRPEEGPSFVCMVQPGGGPSLLRDELDPHAHRNVSHSHC